MTATAQSKPGWITLAMAGLIAAGYADLSRLQAGSLAAFLPLACAVLARKGIRISSVTAIGLCLLLVVMGLVATMTGLLESGGAPLALLEGLMLTLAVAVSPHLMSEGADGPTAARISLIAPALLGLWSLSVMPAIALSASTIAAGHPFCIAQHGDSHAIDSWADLRGLSLYTTRTGYKSTSHWYLHAVLIVEAEADWSVWNWSFGAMGFTALPHPDWLTERAGSECTPEPGFLATLAPL